VRDSKLKVRPRIFERGKKKNRVRKTRGKNQRHSLLNPADSEEFDNLCVSISL
jgi:hypothetical protein